MIKCFVYSEYDHAASSYISRNNINEVYNEDENFSHASNICTTKADDLSKTIPVKL